MPSSCSKNSIAVPASDIMSWLVEQNCHAFRRHLTITRSGIETNQQSRPLQLLMIICMLMTPATWKTIQFCLRSQSEPSLRKDVLRNERQLACLNHCPIAEYKFYRPQLASASSSVTHLNLYELDRMRKEVVSHGLRTYDIHRPWHTGWYLCFGHSWKHACTFEFIVLYTD